MEGLACLTNPVSAAGAHRPLPTQFNDFLQKTSARQLHTVVREPAALLGPDRPGTARSARENPSLPGANPVRHPWHWELTGKTNNHIIRGGAGTEPELWSWRAWPA